MEPGVVTGPRPEGQSEEDFIERHLQDGLTNLAITRNETLLEEKNLELKGVEKY